MKAKKKASVIKIYHNDEYVTQDQMEEHIKYGLIMFAEILAITILVGYFVFITAIQFNETYGKDMYCAEYEIVSSSLSSDGYTCFLACGGWCDQHAGGFSDGQCLHESDCSGMGLAQYEGQNGWFNKYKNGCPSYTKEVSRPVKTNRCLDWKWRDKP